MPGTKQTELSNGEATTAHPRYSNMANLQQPQPLRPRLVQKIQCFLMIS